MRRIFIRLFAALLIMCVFIFGNAHVSFADNLTFTEAYFTQEEEYSGMIDVPGKGPMRYYAQNDPLWGDFAYERSETRSRRPIKDGGCGPTAGAMAIANLIPEEELSAIASYAKQEFSVCPCSINKGKCIHYHARYVLTSQRDFVRFLPLIFADFACGNNIFGTASRGDAQGTGTGFLLDITKAYGVTVSTTQNYSEALSALAAGDTVIGHASRGGAFTNTRHYVLLAHSDAEKLYILDPLCRTEYKTNQSKKIEIIQPGLVAMTHANVSAANIGNYFIFHRDANFSGTISSSGGQGN